MQIKILRANSKEWQSQCTLIQREITAKKGGLIVIFSAKKGEEDAQVLNTFQVGILKIRERTPSGRIIKDCNWEEIYSEFSEHRSETYFLVIQIYNPKSFSQCYLAAGEFIRLYGDLRISLIGDSSN